MHHSRNIPGGKGVRNLKLLSLIYLILITKNNCIPVSPSSSEKPEKPVIEKLELAVTKNSSAKFCEAVYITWKAPETDPGKIKYYTIIRKFPDDSVFSVFPMSQQIPSQKLEFYNILEPDNFPDEGFYSVCYRLYAIDNQGASGDTSEICTLKIAPQPILKSIDTSCGSYTWESWIRSPVTSYSLLWKDNPDNCWQSKKQIDYPSTDQPSTFEAVIPDSLFPLTNGQWHYALFTEAAETKSLKTGFFHVP